MSYRSSEEAPPPPPPQQVVLDHKKAGRNGPGLIQIKP